VSVLIPQFSCVCHSYRCILGPPDMTQNSAPTATQYKEHFLYQIHHFMLPALYSELYWRHPTQLHFYFIFITFIILFSGGWNSVVGVGTGCRVNDRGVRVWIPIGVITFLPQVIWAGSMAHPTFCPVGTTGKVTRAWSWTLTINYCQEECRLLGCYTVWLL
jgi:hypothetical protein